MPRRARRTLCWFAVVLIGPRLRRRRRSEVQVGRVDVSPVFVDGKVGWRGRRVVGEAVAEIRALVHLDRAWYARVVVVDRLEPGCRVRVGVAGAIEDIARAARVVGAGVIPQLPGLTAR